MGRIVATVDIENPDEPGRFKKIDALVDTGASYLTLPSAWKELFGSFETEEAIELQTTTQEVVTGVICGPARIKVEGFRVIYNEALFLDNETGERRVRTVARLYGVAVDVVEHRLISVK